MRERPRRHPLCPRGGRRRRGPPSSGRATAWQQAGGGPPARAAGSRGAAACHRPTPLCHGLTPLPWGANCHGGYGAVLAVWGPVAATRVDAGVRPGRVQEVVGRNHRRVGATCASVGLGLHCWAGRRCRWGQPLGRTSEEHNCQLVGYSYPVYQPHNDPSHNYQPQRHDCGSLMKRREVRQRISLVIRTLNPTVRPR